MKTRHSFVRTLLIPVVPALALGGCANAPIGDARVDNVEQAATFDPSDFNLGGAISGSIAGALASMAARTVTPVGCISGDLQTADANGDVLVSGTWQQTKLPASLTVAGEKVTVAADRKWSVHVHAATRTGLNEFRALSVDGDGHTFNNICAVYTAPDMLSPGEPLKNGVVLGLRQGGIDDGGANLPVKSIGDALRAALASDGLHDLLNDALKDQLDKVHLFTNHRTLLPDVKWYYEYRSLSFDDPDVSVTLEKGALRVYLSVAKLRVNGKIYRDGVFDSHRDFNAIFGSMSATFDLTPKLTNGKIDVDAKVVGDIDLPKPDFEGEGLIGEAIEALSDRFAAGPVRDALEKAVGNAIEDKLPPTLEGLLNGMVEGGFHAASIDVPNFGAPGTTKLSFDAKIGSLAVTDNGMLRVGFDTTVSGPEPAGSQAATVGVPVTTKLPEYFTAVSSDECTLDCHALLGCIPERIKFMQCVTKFGSESAGAVSPALVGQALQALWRAGYFKVNDGKTQLDLLRPPTVFGTADGVRISMGPFAATLTPAGLPAINGHLYARIDVPVHLSGSTAIAFGTPTVADVGFDARGVQGATAFLLPSVVEPAIQSALTTLLTKALSGVGPVAIPSYRIPSSLASFGLPANAKFGVDASRIDGSSAFMTLIGTVGQL